MVKGVLNNVKKCKIGKLGHPLSLFPNDAPLPDHPVRHDHDHGHQQQQYVIIMMIHIAIIREAGLSLSLQTPEVFVGKSSSSKLC